LHYIGDCIVPACGRSRQFATTSPLCAAHRAHKRYQEKKSGVVRSDEEFAQKSGPIHARGNFSLISLPATTQLEFLAAIQAEDRAGYLINPELVVRVLPAMAEAGNSMLDEGYEDRVLGAKRKKQSTQTGFLRRAFAAVRYLRARFEAVDPTSGDIWDSNLVGLQTGSRVSGRSKPSTEGKFLASRKPLDFTPITHPWLRELVKTWARETLPTTNDVGRAIRGFTALSQALSLRPNGDDATTATNVDIQRAVEILLVLKRSDGKLYSSGQRGMYLSAVRRTLHYLWGAGHMDGMHPGFVVTPEQGIPQSKGDRDEDEPGKALPYRVVNALSDAVATLPPGQSQTGSLIDSAQLLKMHQTALRILIDTGRRPNEVCSLLVDCLVVSAEGIGESANASYELRYDNHKAKRKGRLLPITQDTAGAIREWIEYRKTFDLPSEYDKWLFPSPSAGRADAADHLTVQGLKFALKRLVASVPRLEDDAPDKKSGGFLQYHGKIIPYSLRHSYAQRLADAGVGIERVRDLMDHKSFVTTLTYFRVGHKRKREAVAMMASMAMDKDGNEAPFSSPAAYELGAVAVPFGGCTEPSNIKAGGKACPIRFQCAGCGHYRPDPSYLPAIESHLVSLRSSFHMVKIAGAAAPWVLQNMKDEIEAYEGVVERMKARLDELSAEERTVMDDASAAMRKVRESVRPMLPLTVKR